ncbi:biopolymer transporter ExbD [Bordetella sp. J329]|nr:biopolymer transporter ExbD [Bordetella sp. J329]
MMGAHSLETGLYEISRVLLWPVLVLILAALAYSLFALGGFLAEWLARLRGRHQSLLRRRWEAQERQWATDDMELWIMKRLECLRMVSRVAPMLGLIATMIPMGPALLALGSGDTAAVGRNMVVSFAAVILALAGASIAFFLLTIRRRWLLEELREIEKNDKPHSVAGVGREG